MFKILTIGVLIYLFYRIVFIQKAIKPPEADHRLKNDHRGSSKDDGEYVDYEEVE